MLTLTQKSICNMYKCIEKIYIWEMTWYEYEADDDI